MRFFLFPLLLLVTVCSGQETKEQDSKIGALSLVEPKSEPPSPEDTLMFKNSIILFRPDYTVIYEDSVNTFPDQVSLSAHLLKTSGLLKRRKFYVLFDSSTKPDKIILVLELLQRHRIGNFKLINYQEYFKPPQPITYQTPTETRTISKPYDSSYFSIKILDDSLELSLLNKKHTIKSFSEVDQYITINKSLINPSKIVLFANANASYEKFKPVIDILRKHEYYRFKMISF